MRRSLLPLVTLALLGCSAEDTTSHAAQDAGMQDGASPPHNGQDAAAPDSGQSGRSGDGDGDGQSGGDGDAPNSLVTDCTTSPWDEQDFALVFDVGPGKALATPSDVPWETLSAGTLVRIHAQPSPYRDKWVINVSGREDAPVVVRGVPGANGELPQIRGANAVTRSQLNFWGEERAVIKIGGSNTPNNDKPRHIFVECLDIAGARPGNFYTGDDGQQHEYIKNAAAITIETGEHITLRNNVLSDSGNGLFSASGSSEVRVVGNSIHGNGIVGSGYEHNSYTESAGILFEANHYGPLCDGCPGNNLKDRSAGTVIRYNWIEGGNRQLDLVDTQDGLGDDPRYHETFVYGNVLHEPSNMGNNQIIHYGGDSDDSAPTSYRKGTLYFFHNTVISQRSGNTTLVRLSTAGESMDARNNLLYVSAQGSALAITTGMGEASLHNNCLPSGFRKTHETLSGSVEDTDTVTASDPGFSDLAGGDFTLNASSPCLSQAGPLAAGAKAHPVLYQLAAPRELVARPSTDDLGAFEH